MTNTNQSGRPSGSGRQQPPVTLTANAQAMLQQLCFWENRERAESGKEPLSEEAFLEALIAVYFGDELEDRVARWHARRQP